MFAVLLGSIGGSLSASELPYWAGHRAVLFSDLDSASFDTECNLTIVYSADGKQYSASVDLPEKRHKIFSKGQCNGSVDKTGVLERQDCTPGTISQRDIIGTVLNPILDNPGGGRGGRCTWADEALLKKRDLILAEAGGDSVSGVDRASVSKLIYKDEDQELVEFTVDGSAPHNLSLSDGEWLIGNFVHSGGAPYSPGHGNLDTELLQSDRKDIQNFLTAPPGSTIKYVVEEEWNNDYSMEWHLNAKLAFRKPIEVSGVRIDAVKVVINGTSKNGTYSSWAEEGLKFRESRIIDRRTGFTIKFIRNWENISSNGPNKKQRLILDSVVNRDGRRFFLESFATKISQRQLAMDQSLAENSKRQLEKRLNNKAGSESASRSGQTKPVNPTQKNKGGANSDRSAEKKDAALENARALAQAKVQAAEKKKRALEKAKAQAKVQAAEKKKRVLENARALAQAKVQAAEKKKRALEKAKTQAQAKYLSKRSNAEHYLAVIKEFVKLNPSVLDPMVIGGTYGPSLNEVKKGGFNKPGSKFLKLVAYMEKIEGFDGFLQKQNKKRAENKATKLVELRSEISSVVDALKARLSADPLAPDAYKLIALIKKFDKRLDKVVNVSVLQKSRDNLVVSAANFGISVSGTVTKKAAQPVQARSAAKNHGVAVIIGNKNYSGDIPDVTFAHNDAKAMKRYVMDFLGFRKGNIVDLRDASKAQMESAFGVKGNYKGLLWQYLRSGVSDVVVFYSGHGVPGLKDGRGYLLPVDSHPQTAELNGYPIDLLYENLGKLAARSVMVFIDSCFSGGSANGMLVKAASPVFLRTTAPKPVKGMTVVTAASNDQVASWDEKAKHGLFTKYLLDGLYGKADGKRYGNGDGRITLGEMKAYLDGEMTYQARRRFGRVQEVTVQGNKEGFLTRLSTSSPRP